jgi:hypothetical protein
MVIKCLDLNMSSGHIKTRFSAWEVVIITMIFYLENGHKNSISIHKVAALKPDYLHGRWSYLHLIF